MPTPRHAPNRLTRRATLLAAATASLLPAPHSSAATVSWATNFGGLWSSTAYWSTHTLPGPTDDVVIDRPNGTYTITLSSGTQSINSLISNENLAVSAGTLAVATTAQIGGTLTLNGGTLIGGTWTTPGAGTISATNATLSGVTLAGNLSVPSGSLTVTNGLTLSAGTLSISTPVYFPSVTFAGAQTLGGSGTVTLSAATNILATTGGLTIAPAVTVANGPASSNVYLGSYGLNQGTLSAPTPGQTLSLNGSYWTNAGTLSASSGGTLRIDTNGSWTNSGTITVGAGSSASLNESWTNTGTLNVDSGGKLTLGGTFTPAAIGTLINNGSVSIGGTLTNTGHTLTLDGNAFSLAYNGNIIGGTINSTATGPATANGTLTGVTLAGNLVVPGNGDLTINNGLTLAGGSITLAPTNFASFLTANGPQTIGGTGSILFNGGAEVTSTGYLTIGPSVTIATSSPSSSGSISLGSYTLNQGTISSQIPGRSISVTGTNWINAGTLAASNGGTLTLDGSWTNSGTLNVGAGSTVYISHLYAGSWSNSGTFNVATGGTLYLGGALTPASMGTIHNNGSVGITGALDNAANTLTLDGSAFALVGGSITGGTVNTTTAGANAYGSLNGVTLAGKLTATGDLGLSNTLTLAGGTLALPASSPVTVRASGTQSIAGTGTVLLGSGTGNGIVAYDGIIDASNGSLTFGPGITVTTASAAGWLLLGSAGANQGTISSRTPGRTLIINGTNWTNAGSLSASNGGTLTLAGSWTNTGTVSVDPSSTLVFANGTTPDGTINLSGTAILNYSTSSPADTLRQQLALGRAGVAGIVLPDAASDPTRALGYAEASTLLHLSGSKTATWSGQKVDATTLLLKPTVNGDANLDGQLTPDDYTLLDQGYASHGQYWWQGDFNYDGVVNASDYLLIDTTYLKQQGGALSPAFLAQRQSQFGAPYVQQLISSVPEPSSLLLLATGYWLLTTPRRRNLRNS